MIVLVFTISSNLFKTMLNLVDISTYKKKKRVKKDIVAVGFLEE